MRCITIDPPFIYFNVKVTTSCKKLLIKKVTDKHILIDLKSDPVNNQANEELTKYISKLLNLKNEELITISKGQQSQLKTLKLRLDVINLLENEITSIIKSNKYDSIVSNIYEYLTQQINKKI